MLDWFRFSFGNQLYSYTVEDSAATEWNSGEATMLQVGMLGSRPG